jgi:hypothetical protein
MSDIEYLYTTSFVAKNDTMPGLNKFTNKKEMLEHVNNLLKIWDLSHMDYEGMIDEAFESRRIFLSGDNCLIVNKISKEWFND